MKEITRTKGPSLKTLRLGSLISDYEENSYDLRGIFNRLNIYSSVGDMITSGDVSITEQGNLISTMPIEGNEYIEIEFCSLNGEYEPYHRIFFVYSIDDLVESKDSRSYTIRFVDVMGIINNDTRLAIRYDAKFEDIVDYIAHVVNVNSDNNQYRAILKQYLNLDDPLVFDRHHDLSVQTGYEMKFVVPRWKPLKTLSYLARRAVSQDSDSMNDNRFCDCFFFQRADGKFIVTNYKKMFFEPAKCKTGEEIVLEKRMGNSSTEGNVAAPLNEPRYGIINYSMPKIFNFQAQKNAGIFGFTSSVTDFLNVRCETEYIESTNIDEIMAEYKLDTGTEYPYTAPNFTTESVYVYNICGIDTSPQDNQYAKFTMPFQKSIAVRPLIEYGKITLELTGSSDLDIGDCIKIDLGKAKNESVTQYINDIKWIIKRVTHSITPEEYKTYVECFTPYINREPGGANKAALKAMSTMMIGG